MAFIGFPGPMELTILIIVGVIFALPILLIVSFMTKASRSRNASTSFTPPPSPSSQSASSNDIPDQIKKLSELKDKGILSEEEFEQKKAELLDKM